MTSLNILVIMINVNGKTHQLKGRVLDLPLKLQLNAFYRTYTLLPIEIK